LRPFCDLFKKVATIFSPLISHSTGYGTVLWHIRDYRIDEMPRGTLLPFCKDYMGRPQRIYVRYVDSIPYRTCNDVRLYGFCARYLYRTVRYGTKPKQYNTVRYGTCSVSYRNGTVLYRTGTVRYRYSTVPVRYRTVLVPAPICIERIIEAKGNSVTHSNS
jgi:hypothetical protein